ncbi:response regulator [Thermodesulfobacteriota bacterium]
MDLFTKLKELKILLIDDDEWIRDSLRLFFESEGCNLLAVETAEEGLEKLKRHNYDIIIVDYRLPVMDGLEFLERIKSSHRNALTLLITAYGNKDIFSKANKIGVNDLIDKPFTIKTIEQSLTRLMKDREN